LNDVHPTLNGAGFRVPAGDEARRPGSSRFFRAWHMRTTCPRSSIFIGPSERGRCPNDLVDEEF
jgi:hypothetical protein